jgi:hypothetical protein
VAEEIADVTNRASERIKGSRFGVAPVCLELGEGLLDFSPASTFPVQSSRASISAKCAFHRAANLE